MGQIPRPSKLKVLLFDCVEGLSSVYGRGAGLGNDHKNLAQPVRLDGNPYTGGYNFPLSGDFFYPRIATNTVMALWCSLAEGVAFCGESYEEMEWGGEFNISFLNE
jgi:hypothetical protein